MEIDHELDVRGLMCPLPLLRLKKALQTLDAGQIVLVQATDPASVLDFGVFTEQSGHTLIECREEQGVLVYLIRKAGK